MKTLKTFILSLLSSFCAYAAESRFTHLTVQDGLPGSTVYHVLQDSRGFIWFCTETGVSRYDGKRFYYFTVADGLADNENFESFEDSRGRIWFLSHNCKLSFFFKGKMYNPSNTPWLRYSSAKGTLLDIAEDKFGNVWLSTSFNETLRITDTVITHYRGIHPYYSDVSLVKTLFHQNGMVMKYCIDAAGRIYLTDLLSQKVSYIADYSALDLMYSSTRNISSVGYSYVPSLNGIVLSKDHDINFIPGKDLGIQASILTCLYDNNTLWVGTAGDGLAKVSAGQVEHLLPGNIITSVLKDTENNLWITTLGNGVFIYKSNYSNAEILSEDQTFSIAALQGKNGKCVIAGLGNGTIKTFGEKGVETLRLSHYKYDRILDIIPQTAGKALICSDRKVYELDIDTRSVISHRIETYKNFERLNEDFWLCTPQKIIRFNAGKLHELPDNAVYHRYTAIAPISDSAYYLGTTKGVYKITGSSVNTIVGDAVLKAGVKDLKMIAGALWIATHGNGVFIAENDKVVMHFNTATSDIAGDFCRKIYDDSKNFVWIATNKGVAVFNRVTQKLFYNISGRSLLSSNDVKDIAVDETHVYVATASGVNKMEIEKTFRFSEPPVVYITSFKKDNTQILDPGNSIAFDYFKGAISIGFATATFLNPDNVLFEYRMAGEKYWHSVQAAELPFFSLKPGTYNLLFRARKYNSTWGRPVSFSITVRPLFFQSFGFKAAVAMVFAGMIYLVVLIRIRQVRNREKEKSVTQKKMLELESKTLSCQMNPHFIFNSLNTVQQFILVKEEEQGLDYLSEFATLMRQILENSKKTLITLSEEISFLERYLQLEQIRYNNKFSYTIHVDRCLDTEDVRIPPVLFQPLLENAIKHGVSVRSNGMIELKMRCDDGYLVGVVEDNGLGIYTQNTSVAVAGLKKESSALKIIEERLKLTRNGSGCQGHMTVIDKSRVAGQGTVVILNIPI